MHIVVLLEPFLHANATMDFMEMAVTFSQYAKYFEVQYIYIWISDSCSWANNCAPSNNCQNGATCVTTDEGYKCYCKTGYTGRYCDTMVDHCSLNHCNNGTCLNSLKGYSCACFAGYAGHHCEYRSNWCASFPCTNLATCLNKADGYVCKCQSGFVGRHCETFEGNLK